MPTKRMREQGTPWQWDDGEPIDPLSDAALFDEWYDDEGDEESLVVDEDSLWPIELDDDDDAPTTPTVTGHGASISSVDMSRIETSPVEGFSRVRFDIPLDDAQPYHSTPRWADLPNEWFERDGASTYTIDVPPEGTDGAGHVGLWANTRDAMRQIQNDAGVSADGRPIGTMRASLPMSIDMTPSQLLDAYETDRQRRDELSARGLGTRRRLPNIAPKADDGRERTGGLEP